MRKSRTFTKELKLDILRELENKSAERITPHSMLVNRWKREHAASSKEAFSGKGKT